jgi:hypothetical protein
MRVAIALGMFVLPLCSTAALAQSSTEPSSVGQGGPQPAPPEQPATVTLPQPSMAGPLTLNPKPYHVDLGPLGTTYISGAVSALGLVQGNAVPGNKTGYLDIDNAQVILQKTDGLFQYYAELGAYSFPALGTPYATMSRFTTTTFGFAPIIYAKLAPTDNFSIQAGKLPTLFGIENTFTFENMNIEFGLLANQEAAVSQGVQANYTIGPVTLSLSINDGYYSSRLNWLAGLVTWTVTPADTVLLAVGGNLGHTGYESVTTPLAQNNGSMYSLSYAHTSDPWTIAAYAQLGEVPKDAAIGLDHGAATYGAALLGNYRFTQQYSLSGRVEWIGSTGSAEDGAPNLLFGPGSKAVSLTVAPTFQFDRYYARVEVSYVKAFDTTPGFVFGRSTNNTNQVRGLVETGVVF